VTEGARAALPTDFVALHAGPAGHEVAHFAAGCLQAAPRPGVRLVLHAALAPGSLRAWEASGALCVPADRLLSLLEPEAGAPVFADARHLGERYLRAAARLRPQSEVLRTAAEVLPATDAALRALLHRSLATLAVAHLTRPAPGGDGREPADTSQPAGMSDALGTAPTASHSGFDWPALPPHDLLDRAFDRLHAWQRHMPGLPFEPRPGQTAMAHAVLDTLLDGGKLVVEAGTGTGKTIAYVLPALVLALTRGGRVLISTHTRNLQHQLVGRDLPEVWRCFGLDAVPRPGGEGTGLRYAKLLGRANYVCRTALTRAARQAAGAGGSFELAQVLVGSLREASGELETLAPGLAPKLRHELASRREVCQGRACRGDFPCPVYTAREAARGADLVIVNHALLFSDAATEGSILGRFAAVIVDEAQHVEAVATEHLSIRVGRPQADALVTPLGGLLTAARAHAGEPGFTARLEQYGREVAGLRQQFVEFFDALQAGLPAVVGRKPRQAYQDGDEVFGGVAARCAALDRALAMASERAQDLATEAVSEASGAAGDEIAASLELMAGLQRETRAGLDFVTTAGDEAWAFYLDLGMDGDALREIVAAPLDVAAAVQRWMEATAEASVYTSATLAIGGEFDYFLQRVGLPATVPRLVVPSPFDYTAQCLVAQAGFLPDWSDAEFEPQVADVLAAIATQAPRRTLVLLTSHAALRRLHVALHQRLGPRAPLLAQDLSGSREQLASRFARTPGALLLGTASFWEGVDFPGQALEVLVIPKLPFLVPDEPLVAARSERLRQQGDDAFGDYVLPEAVLRFKQGFGRLIRSRSDRGVVLLLDPRLARRGYGAAFRKALPVAAEIFEAPDALVSRVVEWLGTQTLPPDPVLDAAE
jgi:Rad3-related DNA helicase